MMASEHPNKVPLCFAKYSAENIGALNTCASVTMVVLIEAGSPIQAGASFRQSVVLVEM